MQLHRTTGEPDWQSITVHERTRTQRLAARTGGIVTPANAITVVGLALVICGLVLILRHHYWPGLGIVAAGRLCDLLDGWLAERTATKSPLGESADAVADKLGTFATIAVFFVAHIAPWWLLAALLIPQLIMPVLTTVAYVRHVPIHPTRLGKLSMAFTWVCMAAFMLLLASGHESGSVYYGVEAMAGLTALLGLYATTGYKVAGKAK